MSFRTVNGNTHTEDGWRCCNRDECDIVRIPDLFLTETAPLRKGSPLTILGAWLYWYDRNVEEIDSSVWGWSLSNDVLGQPGRNNGSNHLSATAVDVNAPKYPWGTYRMPADKIAKVEEGLRLFEGTVFWGRVWSKPDEMHYQMALPEGDARNEAFAQKLRNGYLGIYGAAPSGPPALSKKDQYAVLVIQEGQRRGITPRGIQIALATCLVESNLTMYANARVPESMSIPHEAVGSDAYSVGLFQQQVRDTGNGWWWGSAATCMDPTLSAGLFYDRLSRLDYNGPNSPGSYAQAVQQSAFPDRYDERYGEAVGIYNRLVAQSGDDFLSALTDAEQRELLELSRQQAKYRRKSLSPFRWPFEGDANTCAGFAWTTDANVHVQLVEKLAVIYGDPQSIGMLLAVSRTNEPGRADDAALALRVLNRVTPAGKALGEEWLKSHAIKVTA